MHIQRAFRTNGSRTNESWTIWSQDQDCYTTGISRAGQVRKQGMVWNGMERKFRYGIWKMPEWNGMEDFKNGMEDNLPYQFHTRFVHCIYRKKHTDVG